MPSRVVGTSRPRLLPRAVVASGLVVAAAVTVLAATARPSPASTQSCSAGRSWVSVQPVVLVATDWPSVQHSHPLLTGCLDTRKLVPAAPQTDSRG
jgi:hypothetical protein